MGTGRAEELAGEVTLLGSVATRPFGELGISCAAQSSVANKIASRPNPWLNLQVRRMRLLLREIGALNSTLRPVPAAIELDSRHYILNSWRSARRCRLGASASSAGSLLTLRAAAQVPEKG